MPIATAAGAAIAGGVIGAGGSIIGGMMQGNATEKASRAAIAEQQNARMQAAQILQGAINTAGPRIDAMTGAAETQLHQGQDQAAGALYEQSTNAANAYAQGFGQAGQRLANAGNAASKYLDTGTQRIADGVTGANALLNPYIQTGQRALGVAGDLSGANGTAAAQAAMANFQASPAYQFNLDQGLRAVDAGAAARGMLVSGATRRAEQQFGAGLASNEFSNYYNRLSGLASQGLQASNTAGGNIMQGAAGMSGMDRAQAQTALTQGGALAANDVGWGNALAGTSLNLGNQLSQNSMATGARLADNSNNNSRAIANLYSGNAQTGANLAQQAGAGIAQTQASTGTALASIYGDQAKGITNSIVNGLNNYTYLNALGPQQQAQGAGLASQTGPSYGMVY